MKTTYAVVVTYNGMNWIDRCLGSLLNESSISGIIVIDNASYDGTVEHIKRDYPGVELISNEANLGFGRSNNQGIDIALRRGADYLFLLNQDAWIDDGGVGKLLDVHRENDQYGILSPIHLRGDGHALDMKYATFIAQSENHKLVSDLFLGHDHLCSVYDVKFVNAAAWLISRKCIESVGGFAPIYHHYGEDMDYAGRAAFHGFKIGICPGSVVYHDRVNSIVLPNILDSKQYLKLKKVWNLIYLTDINHSFMGRWIKLLLVSMGKAFGSLVALEGRNAVTYFREWLVLIAIWPKVVINNVQTKKEGSSFLMGGL